MNFSWRLPCAASWLLMAAGPALCCAAEPEQACWRPLGRPDLRAVGTLSCAATSCHDRQAPRIAPFAPRLHEYTQWLEHDPHAQAARTLSSPEFQRILRAMSAREDGAADPAIYIRCAKCHDPQGLELDGGDVTAFLAQPQLYAGRGIGCETCHGKAEQWLDRHFAAGISPDELEALGMVPTSDVMIRARLCAGCHVGDSDRDMNHDMIAAGHPPLRFELSAYHDLLERKHWSDTERVAAPNFKSRLWAAGQLAVADATLSLLAGRADRAAAGPNELEPAAPWPELAEYDCLACHQRLRPGGKTSHSNSNRRASGTPAWQPWNVTHAAALFATADARNPFANLQTTMAKSLATSPEQIGNQCREARRSLRALPLPEIFVAGNFTAADVLGTVELGDDRPLDWSGAAQDYLALKAAFLTLRDQEQRDVPAATSSAAGWEAPVGDELLALVQSLRFGSSEFEWPAFDWDQLPELPEEPPYRDLESIGNALGRLRESLRNQLPPMPAAQR
jgi:hypothetical protein